MTQLAPGGRLILDLRGKIGGGLMVLTKQEDGSALGRFLVPKEPVSFMGLREATTGPLHREIFEMPSLEEQIWYGPRTVEFACAEHFCSYEEFRGADDAFNLWVQCLFPSLSIKWIQREQRSWAVLTESGSRTTLVIERQAAKMGVGVKGVRPLWGEMRRAYEDWLALGKPGPESYVLLMTAEKQEMRVELAGESRVMVMACCGVGSRETM